MKTTEEKLKEIVSELNTIIESISTDKKTEKASKQGLSLEQVRKVLTGKAREGMGEKIRELLSKYGASKLSELKLCIMKI